ncbi:Aste57867_22877 [Aphanomyces stellatus]|uniref:Aste57867_22877 protein n=1 Tax=Aphanomyces stellatus TaxID=120398 RepID=A0A485LLC6_9STRA|nr:hypothetical protein As57867_022806 [Aphanomyces stellatus]VFT99527.1 Aste57867_22877 [Aphanomyces stellatus]
MGGAWSPEEDARLKQLVQEHGPKWSLVSALMAGRGSSQARRNRKQCRERYTNYLDPMLRHDRWTESEDAILRRACSHVPSTDPMQWSKIAKLLPRRSVEYVKNQWRTIVRHQTASHAHPSATPVNAKMPPAWSADENAKLTQLCSDSAQLSWLWIASHFPKRTDLQCRQHWTHVLQPGLKKGKGSWTPEEDDLLRLEVHRLGPLWTQIARKFPGRIAKQCRERYKNHADPTLNKGAWTADEDAILVEAQQGDHRNQWTFLASLLPGRLCRNGAASLIEPQGDPTT